MGKWLYNSEQHFCYINIKGWCIFETWGLHKLLFMFILWTELLFQNTHSLYQSHFLIITETFYVIKNQTLLKYIHNV